MRIEFSEHAKAQVGARGIDESLVRRVAETLEQALTIRPGREVRQSRVSLDDARYLIRVVVDIDEEAMTIVTASRTSKIDRYWVP